MQLDIIMGPNKRCQLGRGVRGSEWSKFPEGGGLHKERVLRMVLREETSKVLLFSHRKWIISGTTQFEIILVQYFLTSSIVFSFVLDDIIITKENQNQTGLNIFEPK